MKVNQFILSLLAVLLSLYSAGQETSYENRSSIGFRTRFRKLELSTEAEMRNQLLFGLVNRLSLDLEACYPLFKGLRAGGSYTLIDFNDVKYDDMQLRHRFSVFATGKRKYGDLAFSLREQLQITFRDESDRIRSDGSIDSYEVNPAWAWRNKIKAAWNLPHSPLTPSFAVESFCRIGKPEGNGFYKMRYTLAADYKLSVHHYLQAYGMLDQEVSESSSSRKWVLGLGYVYILHK